MSRPSSPHVLKVALGRLLAEPGGDAGHAEQFRNAIWAFLDALYQHSRGESLLTEYGTFVFRNTAADTPYAKAWDCVKQLVDKARDLAKQPDDPRWLEKRSNPQTALVGEVAGVRDTIRQALEWDVELKMRHAEAVAVLPQAVKDEDRKAQETLITSLKEQMLKDEARRALEDAWAIACDLTAKAENRQADGCYWLLEMHRHKRREPYGFDCFETRVAHDFTVEIKAAAEFLVDEIEATIEEESARARTDREQGGTGGEPPVENLLNWREILVALNLTNDKEMQRRVKRLNDEFDGPIPQPKSGSQPIVNKEKLVQWWNGLEDRARESKQRRRDAKTTVEIQHDYGRDGAVVPEIGGGVKRRRKDRKP